ncbi:hypothetical protein PDE_02558 [Penicillium oxalicum 114-2]|uniref:Uncharacterized protein n=1 Tax=Penicillium oxalicum (strain 114-2 / CGMCC 5302) TaxID=933388 RepID=S7ZBJ8_PENO1|nr:hypothetical protein PDE_02558 [Penicillium oxalicum 114-2]
MSYDPNSSNSLEKKVILSSSPGAAKCGKVPLKRPDLIESSPIPFTSWPSHVWPIDDADQCPSLMSKCQALRSGVITFHWHGLHGYASTPPEQGARFAENTY